MYCIMYPLTSDNGVQLIERLIEDNMAADSPVGGDEAAMDEIQKKLLSETIYLINYLLVYSFQ